LKIVKLLLQSFYRITALSLLFTSAQADTLEVLQQVTVPMSVEYDTNPTISSSNKQPIWRYTVAPKYSVTKTENQDILFANAGLNIQRSSNKSVSVDREDPSLAVGWAREYERGRFSLVGRYDKASSRFNEFTKTGIVDQDGSSIAKSISASWSHMVTERVQALLDAQYLKSTYSGSGFTNSSTKSFNSTFSYELNEKIKPFVQIGVSKLSPEGNVERSTTSQSYLVGANMIVSPPLSMSASLGLNHESANGNGWIANTSANYLAEKYSLQGALSRSITPSGTGQFQKTDNFSLRYSYLLTDKSSAGADFTWSKNSSDNGNEARQLAGWYTKDITELWQLKLSMSLKELKGANQTANASIFGVTFIYNIPEF
jgi:hypothetical protein